MKYKIDSETLTDIADAIRAKTGDSASMTPLEMPDEIASISGGGGATWTEFTATSTAGNTLAARDLLFPNYSTSTSVVFAAILKNKPVANFPNNQFVSLALFKNPIFSEASFYAIGQASRYRSGAYSTAVIAANYDGIIEVGDTFDLLEVEYEVL